MSDPCTENVVSNFDKNIVPVESKSNGSIVRSPFSIGDIVMVDCEDPVNDNHWLDGEIGRVVGFRTQPDSYTLIRVEFGILPSIEFEEPDILACDPDCLKLISSLDRVPQKVFEHLTIETLRDLSDQAEPIPYPYYEPALGSVKLTGGTPMIAKWNLEDEEIIRIPLPPATTKKILATSDEYYPHPKDWDAFLTVSLDEPFNPVCNPGVQVILDCHGFDEEDIQDLHEDGFPVHQIATVTAIGFRKEWYDNEKVLIYKVVLDPQPDNPDNPDKSRIEYLTADYFTVLEDDQAA